MILTLLLLFSASVSADEMAPDSAKDSTTNEPDYILIPVYTRPVSATTELEIKDDKAYLWINNNFWIKADLDLNPESVFEFEHIDGEVKALCLYDKTEMTIEELRELVITNAKHAAYNAKVVFEEIRLVNGSEMLCMRIEGSINLVPFTYFGYYYAGPIGSIQLITISSPQIFDDYEFELESFLDGLEIRK